MKKFRTLLLAIVLAFSMVLATGCGDITGGGTEGGGNGGTSTVENAPVYKGVQVLSDTSKGTQTETVKSALRNASVLTEETDPVDPIPTPEPEPEPTPEPDPEQPVEPEPEPEQPVEPDPVDPTPEPEPDPEPVVPVPDPDKEPSGESADYLATPGETIFIRFNIYNPEEFEFLSITINGTKYQTYQFADGSDSTKIILKMDVGKEELDLYYTVDVIKYVYSDNTIKNVIMETTAKTKVWVNVSAANIADEDGLFPFTGFAQAPCDVFNIEFPYKGIVYDYRPELEGNPNGVPGMYDLRFVQIKPLRKQNSEYDFVPDTPLYALANGTVTDWSYTEMYAYQVTIAYEFTDVTYSVTYQGLADCTDDYKTPFSMEVGQKVKAGDIVGWFLPGIMKPTVVNVGPAKFYIHFGSRNFIMYAETQHGTRVNISKMFDTTKVDMTIGA